MHSSQSENENLNDKSSQDEKKSETIVIAPGKDGSTAEHVKTEPTFYVPRCGLVFYIMAFFGFFCAFALRASLSVAIVAMVNQTAVTEDVEMTNTSDGGQCPRDPALRTADGEFVWDRHQQAAVLAAFYYGRELTQIPGGWLADRFGGKWLYGGSVILSSVISLLAPTVARIHLAFFLVLRVLAGLGEGVMLPAVHALIARWSAPKYRSLIVSSIFTGPDGGMVVGMILSGVLCDFGFAGGWPSAFYVFGVVGCVWSVAWFLLCYDSPSTHPRISSEEREYWDLVLGTRNLVARPPTPWRKLLTSVPVWALAVAFFAEDWGFFTLATCIPLFMHDVLGFDMSKNGTLSAVPFLTSGLLIPFGLFMDRLRSSGKLSTNVVRKTFCASGFILTSCMLVWMGYTGCNRALTVIVMLAAMTSTCISYPVIVVNQLDLAPLHAGKIMGLTSCLGLLGAIAAPHAMGILTYHRSSRSEWRKVFFLAAVVYTVGAIVFVIFGSGERQSWAGTAADDNRKEELKRFTESVQTTDNKQSDDSADVQQSIEL